MIEFVKPQEVHFEELTDDSGRCVIGPLESGLGTTLGNSIRRTLLSMIPGAAITRVKFDGKYHEYDTIEGVREDVIEIIMNLKELSFRLDREESKRLYLDVEGKGEVTAKDIDLESGIELMNPQQPLAHLADNANLGIEMYVETGMGYQSAESNKTEDMPLSVIPIDADFSPVKEVNFTVDTVRARGKENCDQLTVQIETDGGITPEEAIGKAAEILGGHYKLFERLPRHPFGELEQFAEEEEQTPEEFEESLEDLGFNQRACNLLREKDVETLEDLIKKTSTQLLDIHGFGDKTLQKVEAKLDQLGYSLEDREGKNGS